jgi:hypothetical protein
MWPGSTPRSPLDDEVGGILRRRSDATSGKGPAERLTESLRASTSGRKYEVAGGDERRRQSVPVGEVREGAEVAFSSVTPGCCNSRKGQWELSFRPTPEPSTPVVSGRRPRRARTASARDTPPEIPLTLRDEPPPETDWPDARSGSRGLTSRQRTSTTAGLVRATQEKQT